MTVTEQFQNDLSKVGLRTEVVDEHWKFGINLYFEDMFIGFVHWDVIEYDVTEEGKLCNVVVEFWLDDPEGKTLLNAYNKDDMIKKIADAYGVKN